MLRVVEDCYRAFETSKLGMRLAETQTDIMLALLHLCEQNDIQISDGIQGQIAEARRLFKRIEDVNSLPIHEVLKLPSAWVSPALKRFGASPDNEDGILCPSPKGEI
jgi:hypothetical protein